MFWGSSRTFSVFSDIYIYICLYHIHTSDCVAKLIDPSQGTSAPNICAFSMIRKSGMSSLANFQLLRGTRQNLTGAEFLADRESVS